MLGPQAQAMVEFGIEDRTHPITTGFWYVFGIMK